MKIKVCALKDLSLEFCLGMFDVCVCVCVFFWGGGGGGVAVNCNDKKVTRSVCERWANMSLQQ